MKYEMKGISGIRCNGMKIVSKRHTKNLTKGNEIPNLKVARCS
jgi:hypothetical protein